MLQINRGEKYGHLTVIGEGKQKYNRYRTSIVQCDCGSDPITVPNYRLLNGAVTSCGCKCNIQRIITGKQMGLANRKYDKEQTCMICGKKGIASKGLCRTCYSYWHAHKDNDNWKNLREIMFNIQNHKNSIKQYLQTIYPIANIDYKDMAEFITDNTPGKKATPSQIRDWMLRGSIPCVYYKTAMQYINEHTSKIYEGIVRYKQIKNEHNRQKIEQNIYEIKKYINMNYAEIAHENNLSRQAVQIWFTGQRHIPEKYLPILDDHIDKKINILESVSGIRQQLP